ncbi:MAG: hypothetical protein IJV16_04255 [Lachnospiraceae bacterium]|nr:hypothetical protein [Lachnospiraceae bacterium]
MLEVIDEKADNYEQRKKRLKLYERIGFHLTDYVIIDAGEPPKKVNSYTSNKK